MTSTSRKILIITSILLGSSISFASTAMENSPTGVSAIEVPSADKEFKKKIFKGDSEISPEINIGYSSFSGLQFRSSLSYRYFFFDKISLGGVGGYSSSSNSKEYKLGLSGRWYFAETGNWAFSISQEVLAKRLEYNFGVNSSGSDNYLSGATGLGAHYFFTPNVALGVVLNYNYPIGSRGSGALQSRAGLNFNF